MHLEGESFKPLRIIHCFRSPVGGIFRHVRDLVREQVKAGHQVGIICDSTTGGDFEDALFKNLESELALGLYRLPMRRSIGLNDFKTSWRLYKVIKSLNADVLHGHGAKGGAYVRLFGTLLGLKGVSVARIYSSHGGSLHYSRSSLKGKLFFLIERFLGMMTDHLLFVADFERRAYEEKICIPARATVVYNGLHDDEFIDIAPKKNAVDFLFIGMMRDLKGPDLFIDAFYQTCQQTKKPLTAMMVGAGGDLQKYKNMVEKYGLKDQITFFEPMPAYDAFAQTHCVVVSSRAEAMPYIVLEAIASGKPVIATHVGGIPEILGSDCVALCDVHVESLVNKMRLWVETPEVLLSAMPSKKIIKEKFGVKIMALRVEACYIRANK
jgi:glycosyltransferase involved in cell wall biosynthesis